MEIIKIAVKSDFSLAPGPRYKEEGASSGEEFRAGILEPKFEEALKENKKVSIDLDGTFGYGTSFLEEVFGGLSRKYGEKEVLDHIEIISDEEPYLKDDINKYIKEASKGK